MPREGLMETARRVYRSFGYAPIDTPALEYHEILAGKGGEESDRQMYQFIDHGGRHVAMRFDLTVPLARFVAQHIDQLGTPFKRYHIGTVWRGEKSQAGRYREFIQCDFDIIGTTSLASDVETGLVIHELIQAIGFDQFSIRVNHRKVLTGVLEKLQLSQQTVPVLRAIDKLDKAGPESVRDELEACGVTGRPADQLLQMVSIRGSNEEVLQQLQPLVDGNDQATTGLERMRQFAEHIAASGISDARLRIDPSIARGLDYYTGMVFETYLNQDPEIGSVCSGGRYDNLAELFTKRELPGIGASLGLDRLLAAMQRLDMLPAASTPAQVLIVNFDEQLLTEYLNMAGAIRRAGIGVEIYPETKRLAHQFKYADRRGFAAAVVAGSNEFQQQKLQVKWLAKGHQLEVALDENCTDLVRHLSENLPNLSSTFD